jgi:hypothetical protein
MRSHEVYKREAQEKEWAFGSKVIGNLAKTDLLHHPSIEGLVHDHEERLLKHNYGDYKVKSLEEYKTDDFLVLLTNLGSNLSSLKSQIKAVKAETKSYQSENEVIRKKNGNIDMQIMVKEYVTNYAHHKAEEKEEKRLLKIQEREAKA